jgi:hypothetical protein
MPERPSVQPLERVTLIRKPNSRWTRLHDWHMPASETHAADCRASAGWEVESFSPVPEGHVVVPESDVQPKPGEMHPVDKGFYELAVKERDYERRRVDRLESEMLTAEESKAQATVEPPGSDASSASRARANQEPSGDES